MWIYIIECSDGSLYTGIADDPDARFEKHRVGKGAKYFSLVSPNCIVYRERAEDKSEALRRERQIKALSRKAKIQLVQAYLDDPLWFPAIKGELRNE